jgi:hypothetical protein
MFAITALSRLNPHNPIQPSCSSYFSFTLSYPCSFFSFILPLFYPYSFFSFPFSCSLPLSIDKIKNALATPRPDAEQGENGFVNAEFLSEIPSFLCKRTAN